MASVNRVILVGNLGKDPEVRTFQNGGKVMNFSLATNSGYKDKDGNWQEKTEWHDVVLKDEKLIDRMEQKLVKGSVIYLEGEIATRKYEKEGVERRVTEIVVPRFSGSVTVISGGRNAGNRDGYEAPAGSSFKKASGGSVGSQNHSKAKQDAFNAELDDEMPF